MPWTDRCTLSQLVCSCRGCCCCKRRLPTLSNCLPASAELACPASLAWTSGCCCSSMLRNSALESGSRDRPGAKLGLRGSVIALALRSLQQRWW